MSTNVFLVVLLAALLHACWNGMVKGTGDKLQSVAAVVIGHAPFAIACLFFVPLPNAESLPYLAGGIVLHLGYQLFLAYSYRIGDLTQVYPIARGSAPLIVAAVSVTVLSVDLSPPEILAITIIGLGIMSLVLVRSGDGSRNPMAGLTALITGCFIASYSICDGLGARAAGTAVGFYAWLTLVDAAAMAAIVTVVRPDAIRHIFTDGRKFAIVGGGASFLAYALVVWSFTQAPIALVTALRETSIIFALLIGVVLLKERLNLIKLVATMTAIAGVAILRISR